MKRILACLFALLVQPTLAQVPGQPPAANNVYWPAWYFLALDSTPTTHVWSTAAGAYVAVSDAGYLAFIDANGAPVTAAVNNGSGLIRLTLASGNGGMYTGEILTVHGVTGTTEANGTWAVTPVGTTQVDLQGSTFTNTYVSGGVIQGFSYPTAAGILNAVDAFNKGQFNRQSSYTSTTLTADASLTNPMSSWNDVTNVTSDGLKLKLPQVNVPNGPPIGQSFIFNNSNTSSTKTVSIRGFGDTSLGAQVLYPQSTVIATLKSNATTDGTWAFYYPTFQAGAGNAGALAYSNTESWTSLANPGAPGYLLGFNNSTLLPQWQHYSDSSFAAAAGYPLLTFAGGSVDFNTTNTDYPITIASPTTNYRASAVYIYGCSATITTATFTINTAASAGGTALLGATTGTVTSGTANAANSLQSVSITGSVMTNNATLYFRLGTAEGAPATCSVDIQIQPLP